MNSKWYNNLSDAERDQLDNDYKACALTRERLAVILEKEIDKSLREMRDVVRSGSVPHLTEYYADELSKQRTLEWVVSLIK